MPRQRLSAPTPAHALTNPGGSAARPPPLKNLRTFCRVAHCRSFRRAADQLFLTASAVSHQIKELEKALGIRLFERRKASELALTDAGHTLFREMEPLLEAIGRCFAQIAGGSGRRKLRVSLPPFFASEMFVPRLATFCQMHPDVDIELDTLEPRPATHPPAADASILLTHTVPPGLKATRLFSLRLVAVSAKESASAVERLGPDVFRHTALIVHKARPLAWTSWAQEVGLDTPEPRRVIELDTMFAVVRAAERGIGVALVPIVLCDAWLRSGALVRIFPQELVTQDAYFLVTRPRDADRPEVKALIRWALTYLAPCPARHDGADAPGPCTI